jgi:ribosomal protein S18 acetylase RimI-like enzyme
MERNMAGHFSYLARATGGMAVHDRDGLLLVDSSLPCDSFNLVFCWGQPADADLQDSVHYFQSRRLPFAVWVGPASTVAAALERFGLRSTEAETGMLLDAADFRPCALPRGLTVERVADPDRLAHFAEVVRGQPPDASVERFYQLTGAAVFGANSPMRLVIGYADGKPVAAAEAFVSDGVGGVYSVVTVGEYRRRGIGSAMTALAVREGFAAGARLAVLQASPEGQGIYERLGFRAACAFPVFH